MTKFLLKILLLVFLVILPVFLGLGLLKYPANYYMMAAVDKRKLLESVESPRIIFIGGSNLLYSLDSRSVEEAMGEHVVNMGISGNLGLRYDMAEVKPYIKKGDAVIIVPEYENFFGSTFEGGILTTMNFINFPQDRNRIWPFRIYVSILRNSMPALISRLSSLYRPPDDTFVDMSRDFNEYKDYIGHLDKNGPDVSKIEGELAGELNYEVVPELNNFKSYCDKIGAKVYLIFPCLIESQYKKNEKRINLIYEILQKKLKITMLSSPQDYVFANRYFYDTFYHVNREGRQMRTQRVIMDLKKVLFRQ